MTTQKDKNDPNYIPDIPEDEQVKFQEELADTEDLEAQARAKAASRRVNTENI